MALHQLEQEILKESRDGEVDRRSMFCALSIGNLSIRFQDRSRLSLRIAVERPTAKDDNFPAVLAGMRKFATPSVLALEFFANIGERLGMNRAQQFVCDFAKRLLTRIAVQFARAIIPITDAVLPVANEDRIVARDPAAASVRSNATLFVLVS